MFWRLFAFCVLTFGLNPSVQAAERLMGGQALYPSLQILEDRSKSLTLPEVIESKEFKTGNKIVGFKDLSLWTHFQLENPSEQRMTIVIEDQWILTNYIDIYVKEASGILQHYELGHKRDLVPGREKHRYPYALVQLAPGISDIYVHYRSDDIMGSRLAVWHPDDFDYYKMTTQLIYGLLLGSILVMSLYNFILYLTLRYPAYLYYSLYSLTFLAFQLCFSGFLSQLSGQYPWWIDEGTAVFASLAMVFIVLFTQSFLRLSQYSILMHRLGHLILVLAVTAFVWSFINFHTCVILVILSNVLVASWLALAAIHVSFQKVPEAKVFLVAWGVFVVGDLFSIAYYTGYAPPHVLTQWGMIVGSALEIVLLSFGLAGFVNRIKRAMEAAKEELNRELADNLSKVEAQVSEKTRDIKLILQNIQQGIFTLYGPQLLIHEEHSAALLAILDHKHVAGRGFVEVFLDRIPWDSDQKSQIVSTLITSLNDSLLNFELNAHILPGEAQYASSDGSYHILELFWQAMENKEGIVDRILVTVRDVTAFRDMKAREAAQTEEIGIISDIIQRNPRQFDSFIRASKKLLQRCQTMLEKAAPMSVHESRELFRLLHTLKGNSRAQQLPQLASAIHRCEERLQASLDPSRASPFHAGHLAEVLAEFGRFDRVFERYFSSFIDASKVSVSHQTALSLVSSLWSSQIPCDKGVLSDLVQETLPSFGPILADLRRDASRIARELGKDGPLIAESIKGVHLSPGLFESMSHILGHLLRNSLDHGLEGPEERVAKDKSPAGTIHLRWERAPRPTLIWSDDGRGLDLEKIQARALEKGLIQDPQDQVTPAICQAVIFESGFSTKTETTEISGRGVGLNAVAGLLKEVGASLELRFLESSRPEGWKHFEIHILLPSEGIFCLESQITRLQTAS